MSIKINKDEFYMKEALNEAEKAYGLQEIPIGAVIVKDGEVIGRGHNRTETTNDPTAHAEMIAIKNASKSTDTLRLSECTMYVTAEPCTMCAGALVLSRMEKVVIGTESPKSGACYTLKELLSDERLNHMVKCKTGVLKNDCSKIMTDFFKELRSDNKSKSEE